ncbi:MAG TPA: hypothetical protein VLE51_01120 [Candidatus Saccharimonadales bacterium]|nr:hypothetical protein [Candidatus Saccharimonadales bacterium]
MADQPKNKPDAPESLEDSGAEAPSTPNQPTTAQPTEANPDKATQASGTNEPDKPGSKLPILKWFVATKYLIIFFVLIIVALAVVFFAFKQSKNSSNRPQKAGSLTSSQLANLQGATTVVGDAKQTLDVQSNSVFEGQVLVRNDLSVAGTIKTSNPLSVSAITVGGTGNFGQLQASGKLSIAGDATVQGQLSVQKSLTVVGSASFGSLSASQLTVSSLQINGDLSVSHHLISSGGIPGKTNGSALGTGGTASVSGSDTAGTINIGTGSSPPAGCFITINFAQKFNNTPHVVISPTSSSAAGLDYYVNKTNTGFSVCTANAPTGSTTYLFDYIVID